MESRLHEPASPSRQPDEAALAHLQNEMKESVFGIRCLFAVLGALPLYYCTRVLLAAPQFETMYEDMLGGGTRKLPLVTNVILHNATPLLMLVWVLAGLS